MRRRSLLRRLGVSIVGAGLLTGSGTTETDSSQTGVYYEILGDGTLRYIGPTETDEHKQLKAATSMFNAGKRRGDWSFRLPDEHVLTVSDATDTSTVQSACGSCRARSASASQGKSRYEISPHWQGVRHTFWFNDHQCEQLRNRLAVGAGIAEIAAVVSVFYGPFGAGAAAAATAGGILAGTSAGLLELNNEGKGVKLWFHAPNVLDFDIFEMQPQR